MYGLVNQAVEALIRARFGDERWDAIKSRAKVGEPAFVSMRAYPDEFQIACAPRS